MNRPVGFFAIAAANTTSANSSVAQTASVS
jgi:hypothetical protein